MKASQRQRIDLRTVNKPALSSIIGRIAGTPCLARTIHLLVCVLGAQIVTAGEDLAVKSSLNTRTLPLYDVLEITFQHEGRYADPFFEVTVDVTFTAPSGKQIQIGGFHYGSSAGPDIRVRVDPDGHGGTRRQADYHFAKQDLWKARFAPGETGHWTYAYTFTNAAGGRAAGSGSFACVKGRAPQHGFVRPHPTHPFRWVFDDGTPYFPIGLQECIDDTAGVGSVLAAQSLEGPFRLDRKGRPDPPPGALFRPGPAGNPVNGDVYFRQYARAGFNLFRFSQKNCSLPLYSDLDHYLPQQGVMVDELLQHARRYGFRIFYGLFGYQPVFNDDPENAAGMAKLRRFVKYSVDRWGAYVDFWEFLNEQKADARWYAIMTPYLRSIDPYQHPITTSWERPELPGIEINAPHWYAGLATDLSCDRDTADHARTWKRYNKPVIVGEQGNSASPDQLKIPGIGGVWDVGSSTRMRIRNWTALFTEIAFIFWNTSYAKDGHSMNIWLGPQERQYVRALQDFANRLDRNVRMTPVSLSDPTTVRAWALLSPERAAVYLHHFTDHTQAVSNLTVTLDVPKATQGYWYAPENAAILRRIQTEAGPQTLPVPPFAVDLALLMTPAGPPDLDHDSLANDLDLDDDNDGVPDTSDAFPLDPEESADQDGDLIGDNFDADIDADGRGDDKNKNGLPDHEEMDFDGDGIPKANAVPWDAFPLDPKEWRDTDGDGLGDNQDTDKDGDGWSDEEEQRAGTDPVSRLSFPSGSVLGQEALPAAAGHRAEFTILPAPNPAGRTKASVLDWPGFRGPSGNGLAPGAKPPVVWSETTNIAWKVGVTGRGRSSPVLLGDRIWLTTAVEQGVVRTRIGPDDMQVADHVSLRAVCLDRASGHCLWERTLFDVPKPDPVHWLNSWATPTPVAEPGRVYCDFGTFGTACLDAGTGEVLWQQQLRLDHQVGPASSPVLCQDRLVLVRDGRDAQYVAALDKNTGRTLWKTDRPPINTSSGNLKKSFSTPLAIEQDGQTQLIAPGAHWTVAYNPLTGEEIWRVRHGEGFSIGTSPVFGHGMVYFGTGCFKAQLWAVRPDGNHDLTEGQVAWKSLRQVPVMSSPVLLEEEIYWVSDDGMASCVDARTGQVHWQERLGGPCLASPLSANGRLYFFRQDARTVVVKGGKQYERLAENPLEGTVVATPAISDRALYLRTDSHLYCLQHDG